MKNLGFIRKYDSRRKTIFVFLLISLKNNHTNVKFNKNISCLVTTKVIMIIFFKWLHIYIVSISNSNIWTAKNEPTYGRKSGVSLQSSKCGPRTASFLVEGRDVVWTKLSQSSICCQWHENRIQFCHPGGRRQLHVLSKWWNWHVIHS